MAYHLLDLLPGLGSQMQDPEILVMIELFSVGRCKLPAKHPELPASCGHHCHLPGEEGRGGSDKRSESRDRTSPIKHAAAPRYQRADKQQQLLLPCGTAGAEGRGIFNPSYSLCSTPSPWQRKADQAAGPYPPPSIPSSSSTHSKFLGNSLTFSLTTIVQTSLFSRRKPLHS